MSSALTVHGLSLRPADGPEFQDIELNLETGEAVALTSLDSADLKSLLEVLAGLKRPLEGRVNWERMPALSVLVEQGASLTRRYRSMRWMRQTNAFVADDVALLNNLNVYDNVALPLRYHFNAPEDVVSERCERLLKLLKLDTLAMERPAYLQPGVRRRAILGRALILEPSILFIDGPLANIDHESAHVIVETLSHFAKKAGLTILAASYEPRSLLDLVSRVVVLNDGRVVEELSGEELAERKFSERFGQLRGERRRADRRERTATANQEGDVDRRTAQDSKEEDA